VDKILANQYHCISTIGNKVFFAKPKNIDSSLLANATNAIGK
jgi:hypothetical protein